MKIHAVLHWTLWVAITTGLAGCATPRDSVSGHPSDPEISRLAAFARTAFDSGSPDKAVSLYREALQHSEALDDRIFAAHLSFNLAASLFRIGDLPGARAAAREASEIAASAGVLNVETALLRARIALAEHQPDQAESACTEAKAGRLNSLERTELALLRSEIASDRSDSAAADQYTAEAKKRMPRSAPSALKARLYGQSGEGLLRAKRPVEAAAEFERQAAAFREARYAPGVSSALLRAAEAWGAAQENRASADCSLRAARSLWAQQRFAAAQSVADAALARPSAGVTPSLLEALNRIRHQEPSAP